MRALRIPVWVMGGLASALLLRWAAADLNTQALWSDQARGPALHVTAMNATATTSSLSALMTASGDPQQFTAVWQPGQNGAPGDWVYTPATGCTLPAAGGGTATHPLCLTYSFDVSAAETDLLDQIDANPPNSPNQAPTYTVAAAVRLDLAVQGPFSLDLGYAVTGGTGPTYNAALKELTASTDPSLCGATAAQATSLGGTAPVIPAGYAAKTATWYVCYTLSFTPYLYQNTATASTATDTKTDTWWGTFVEPPGSGSTAQLTLGLNPGAYGSLGTPQR